MYNNLLFYVISIKKMKQYILRISFIYRQFRKKFTKNRERLGKMEVPFKKVKAKKTQDNTTALCRKKIVNVK